MRSHLTRDLAMALALTLLLGCADDAPSGDGRAADASVDGDDPCKLGFCGDGPLPDGAQDDASDAAGSWRSLAALPLPQQECGVVALGGKLYVVGGFGRASARLKRVVVYDPTTDKWRGAADLPTELHHPNTAVHGGKIYVVGSLRGFEFRADGATFVYDPASDRWLSGPAMSAGRERGGGVAVTIGDTIYVFGGLRGGAKREADALDLTSGAWRAVADLPEASDHLAGGVIGGKVYLAGGRQTNISAHRTSLLIYDPKADSYTRGPAMPTSRAGLAAAVAAGKLYVFGGEGNTGHPSGVFDDNEAYDPATGTWTRLAPITTRRHGTGAATIGDKIYLPGGAAVQAFGASDVHEVFTP